MVKDRVVRHLSGEHGVSKSTTFIHFPSSALTLLARWQKGHLVCKPLGDGLSVVAIRLERCTSHSSSCQQHLFGHQLQQNPKWWCYRLTQMAAKMDSRNCGEDRVICTELSIINRAGPRAHRLHSGVWTYCSPDMLYPASNFLLRQFAKVLPDDLTYSVELSGKIGLPNTSRMNKALGVENTARWP